MKKVICLLAVLFFLSTSVFAQEQLLFKALFNRIGSLWFENDTGYGICLPDKYEHMELSLFFGPDIGYLYILEYSLVLTNDVYLNFSMPIITTYPGLNKSTGKFSFCKQLEPKIVFSHQNNSLSINMNMISKNDVNTLALDSMTIKLSVRF